VYIFSYAPLSFRNASGAVMRIYVGKRLVFF
jgi:hypothetical protein